MAEGPMHSFYFSKAVMKVLRHEGVQFDEAMLPIAGKTGYSNHPEDPGRETNYGITRAVATELGYHGPMRDLPFPTVLRFYHDEYWNRIRGGEIQDEDIALELFDTAVNCGVKTVSLFLQRTLNALNVKGTKYPDLVVDGKIGNKTVFTLNAALQVAPWYRLCILRALDSLQCVRYIELAEEQEKFETFMPGWLRVRVGVKD